MGLKKILANIEAVAMKENESAVHRIAQLNAILTEKADLAACERAQLVNVRNKLTDLYFSSSAGARSLLFSLSGQLVRKYF